MRDLFVLDRPAHLEIKTVAHQHERNVVECVRITLAQLVGPDDERVVEQAAAAARLRRIGESFCHISQLFAIPFVYLNQLLLRLLVAVGMVRELVVSLGHAQPAHASVAHGVGDLKGCDAGKVSREAVDHQVDLHLCDLGHVGIFVLHAGLNFGHCVSDIARRRGFEFVLHFPHEGRVLFEQLSVFRAHDRLNFAQIILNVVKDALQALLVLESTIELGKHLVRIVDGSDGPVGAGIDHACPRICAIWHHDTEFKRSESSARVSLALESGLDFLIDRRPFRPAGGRVGAPLDVAGKELDSGEQAAHPAHVIVAVAAKLVTNAVEYQRAITKRGQRRQTLFELKPRTFFVRPERGGHDAVGAEHDN